MKLKHIIPLLFAFGASCVCAEPVNTYYKNVSGNLNSRTGFADASGTEVTYSANNVWIFDSDKATVAGTGTTINSYVYSDQTVSSPYNLTECAGVNFEKFGSTLKWVNMYFYVDASSKALDFTNSLGEENVFLINGDLTRGQNTAGAGEAQVYIKFCNHASSDGYSITSEDNLGLHITGDVNLSSSSTSLTLTTFFGGTGNDVALNTGTTSAGVNLKTLTVDGKFILGTCERVNLNVGKYYESSVLTDKTYASADVKMNSGLHLGDYATIYLRHAANSSNAHKVVYDINGLYADHGKIQNTNNTNAETLVVIMLTNRASVNATYSGRICDTDMNNYGSSVNVHTKIVMNGEGSQTLIGSNYFTGGVDILKGTLAMNAANQDVFKQGDLTIKGGRLEIIKNDSVADPARFTSKDFFWSGGVVKTAFLDSGVHDMSALMDFAGGVYLDLGNDKYIFEFSNVVDSGTYIIMQWADDSLTKSDESRFEAIAAGWDVIFEIDEVSKTLSATFVIPEPSTVAAIMGVLVLAFAAYRRRK